MRQFTVHDDFNLYKKHTFTFERGVTCLVGKNGSGKSTLLRSIKRQLEKDGIPYYHYDNYNEGGASAKSKYGFHNKFDLLATAMFSSEGQQIMLNYGETLQRIGGFIRKNLREGKKEMYILLDALDSGLDISNIREIRHVFNLMLEEGRDADIYIIVAANTFEMVKDLPCVAVSTSTHYVFKEYGEFADFICGRTSKKRKGDTHGKDRAR